VTAEVIDLELRAMVARDALAVASSEPTADGDREKARGEAARAMGTEARLLCVSARLLAPSAEGLKEAEASLAELDKAQAARPAPVDLAMRVRAQCLSSLTAARRATVSARGAAGAAGAAGVSGDEADTLLSELSREGTFSPLRDDRGVVVTLHDAFSGDGLAKATSPRVEALARVAAAHASMPVLVVVHDEAPTRPDDRRAERRAEAVRKLLGRPKGERLDLVLAGNTRPIADPKSRKERGRNERLEIVFVDPGAGG
jgi:hypothetical protein